MMERREEQNTEQFSHFMKLIEIMQGSDTWDKIDTTLLSKLARTADIVPHRYSQTRGAIMDWDVQASKECGQLSMVSKNDIWHICQPAKCRILSPNWKLERSTAQLWQRAPLRHVGRRRIAIPKPRAKITPIFNYYKILLS